MKGLPSDRGVGYDIDLALERGIRLGCFDVRHWGILEVRRAERYLARSKSVRLKTLSLINNSFENGCFYDLMSLFGQCKTLQHFCVSIKGPLDLKVFPEAFRPRTLETLEVRLGFDVQAEDIKYLQCLLAVPKEKFKIVFLSERTLDHVETLQALRIAVDRLPTKAPRIEFGNVAMYEENFQNVLRSFVAAVCQTNVLGSLEISPKTYMEWYNVSDFVRALIPLLVYPNSCLQELRIGQLEGWREDLEEDRNIINEFRMALQGTSSLRALHLPNTFFLSSWWTRAIFPALAVNRTLRVLDFGQSVDDFVVKQFLKYLPSMGGLREVYVPWFPELRKEWHNALQQTYTLSRVHFTDNASVNFIESFCRRNRNIKRAKIIVQDVWRHDARQRLNLVVDQLARVGNVEDDDVTVIYMVLRGTIDLFETCV